MEKSLQAGTAATPATADPSSALGELTTVPNHTPVEGITAAPHGGLDVEELTRELASRDQFIAAIGHELRNAVAPLILLAEQFSMFGEQADVPAPLAKRIPMLDRNLRSFVATVERVTQVAHLRASKITLSPITLDLVDAVRAVEERLRPQIDASGATVTVDAPAPVVGQWDPERVEQILHHLLSNAVRYGGGSAIEIAVRADERHAYLTVRDHGPGMSGDIATVFRRFEHTSSRHAGGFGVGLFVVQRSCALLGGSVAVENAEDGGARFNVVLPRA